MFDLERKSKPTCLLRRRAADGGRPLRIALFTWESLHTIAVGGVISLHARACSCLCAYVRARPPLMLTRKLTYMPRANIIRHPLLRLALVSSPRCWRGRGGALLVTAGGQRIEEAGAGSSILVRMEEAGAGCWRRLRWDAWA